MLNDTDLKSRPAPVIVPRSDHNISRANISPNALKVLYRLRSAGFAAFLVGGGVRDLLLDRHPKDFDVVEVPFAERGTPQLVKGGALHRPEPEAVSSAPQ